MIKFSVFISVFFMLSHWGISQNKSSEQIYSNTLKQLSELKIITGTTIKKNSRNSPSNITIITKKMIDERGYQTLVDLCQDIPGFDFMMFNDGSGEFSTFNMNRGVGSIGNPNILIMIDGIIQNNISFNWSLLWTHENMFIDIERVEIVEGPGSVLYGAQAFTGVIHLITKNNFSGSQLKTTLGSNLTIGNDIYLGSPLAKGFHASLAIHTYHSDGDKGLNRHDPGGYFTNNKYPEIISTDYDNNGSYIQNTPNPKGGTFIPDGFNTSNNSYAIRGKLKKNNSELGFFYSEFNRGYSSANVHYEYNVSSKDSKAHFRSFHTYFSTKTAFGDKLTLESTAVFRGTHILPNTGFKYLYRFVDLTKRYSSYAYQGYIEEKLLYQPTTKSTIYFGLKAMVSQKSERIVSLGNYSKSHTTTVSSWDIAEAGGGLDQQKTYTNVLANELAAYMLWDNDWNKGFSTSLGIRVDASSEFGVITNPRLSLIYNSKSILGAKLIYGTAFRQPSIFELTSEFRGNPILEPEKIKTVEFELNSLFLDDKISIKATTYYSILNGFIGKVPDPTMPSGERFENLSKVNNAGITMYLSAQIIKNTYFYSNYNYIIGINPVDNTCYEIERAAKNKYNLGLNIKFLKNRLTTDFRVNIVGKRKSQKTNTWLQTYEKGYAPGYAKANFVVGYKFINLLTIQLVVNNIFDAQYYGIGRETGSGFIDAYDYQNNSNPQGHIPAYHPQPGRTFLLNFIFKPAL